ncbi:MAG: helix-turn-helix transcriptional regulator [Alphaproteobacteria bacterium]|nr:helix-turn-helix transcriptional regulator [Alphaproteobacteria bacterium]
MEDDLKDFKDRLKEYRISRGWSKKYIADQLGMSTDALLSWENGTRTPPVWVQELMFYKMKDLGLPENVKC